MQHPNKITEYLESVCQQIRWKRAQAPVLEEIKNHITDQKNAYISDGLNEETATDRAITEMGDPIVVGEQLDRAHRPRPDWPLLVMIAAMLILGLAIQFLVGPNIHNGTGMLEKQIVWAGIAILVMFSAYFIDFTIIVKYPKVVFFALFVIIAGYLLTGRVNSWSINVIYLLLLFPTAFAGFVYRMRNKGYGALILCVAAFIILEYFSVLVPNLTVLFLLCTSCLIILTAAVEKSWFNVRKLFAILIIYIPTTTVLSIPFVLMRGEGYVSNRIEVMLNPSLDPTGLDIIGQ